MSDVFLKTGHLCLPAVFKNPEINLKKKTVSAPTLRNMPLKWFEYVLEKEYLDYLERERKLYRKKV